jgi:hypothetical protein
MASTSDPVPLLPGPLQARLEAWLARLAGYAVMVLCLAASASLITWSAADPSFIRTVDSSTRNALGPVGANFADLAMRLFGLGSVFLVLPPVFWALQLITRRNLDEARTKLTLAPAAVLLLACAISALPAAATWPLPYGLGGFLGDQTLRFVGRLLAAAGPERASPLAGVLCLIGGLVLLIASLGMSVRDLRVICRGEGPRLRLLARTWHWLGRASSRGGEGAFVRREPTLDMSRSDLAAGRQPAFPPEPVFDYEPPVASAGGRPGVAPSGKRVNLRRPIRQPLRESDAEAATDPACQDMARRFAPARDEPAGATGFAGLLRRRGGMAGAQGESPPESKPVWPGSVPATADDELPPIEPYAPPCDDVNDERYGRAVALVRSRRKVSTDDLQHRLGIGFMEAADLILRMEREGIVGAPIRNGGRPILRLPAPRPRIV